MAVFECEVDGDSDGLGDPGTVSLSGLETPAPNGVHGRLVEYGVSAGFIQCDTASSAIRQDFDQEQHPTLGLLLDRPRRVERLGVVQFGGLVVGL